MPAPLRLQNHTFGKLVVIGRLSNNRHGMTRWLCHCSCGNLCAILGTSLKQESTKSCGCYRAEWCRSNNKSGSKAANWRGGKSVTYEGYVRVYCPDHPRAKSDTYVLEHVLVMEQRMGRHLYPGENVHHKNGVRDDNSPENLELWITSQPSGQRPEDLVKWAEEILARYRSN